MVKVVQMMVMIMIIIKITIIKTRIKINKNNFNNTTKFNNKNTKSILNQIKNVITILLI